MKTKLKEYINTIFADAERRSPHNRQIAECKEEMLRNLEEKYDDLIAAGKTPAAAYNIAIAGVGDISDLLEELASAEPQSHADANADTTNTFARQARRTLTPEEREQVERYRRRSAIVTPIAIALYILATVPCIMIDHVISVVLLFVIVAIATALLIYNYMSRPKFDGNTTWDKDDDDDEDDFAESGSERSDRPRRSPLYGAISGPLWCVAVCVYLLVSFQTGWWHFTWLIFLITTAIDNIIKAIFDLRR